jgi:hypothetical protein
MQDNKAIAAMKRIIMECENDMNHTYGQLNILLNSSDHEDMDSVYQRVKYNMDKLIRLNSAYTSYTEMFAKAFAQFNEQKNGKNKSESENSDLTSE